MLLVKLRLNPAFEDRLRPRSCRWLGLDILYFVDAVSDSCVPLVGDFIYS